MPFALANPNQYLLVGRRGKLENRGTAVQAFLMPGTVFVVVPSTKQEAAFEFTQETRDGIPLRFKGVVLYRITDPVAAAQLFDFTDGNGIARISNLLTHVCLGELRDAVSHMTMAECIEQRKASLSGVVRDALESTIHGEGGTSDWGISLEVAQLAQVFIVDAELRHQLEAEVRNEIKLKSDRSDIQTSEDMQLSAMTSAGRVAEQKLDTDREEIRRQEELDLVREARTRRMEAERLQSHRQALEIAQQLFQAEMANEEDRVRTEAPVRLLKVARETEILREELVMRELQSRVHANEVENELLLPRARQAMRREMLPLEQAPRIAEAASRVLQGTNLSIYGEGAELLGQLAPVFETLVRSVRQSLPAAGPEAGGGA